MQISKSSPYNKMHLAVPHMFKFAVPITSFYNRDRHQKITYWELRHYLFPPLSPVCD